MKPHAHWKRIRSLLLCAALLLSLCACGQSDAGAFRILENLGVKRYSVICRKDDKLAPLIDAAMVNLYRSGRLGTICTRWLGKDRISLTGGNPAESLPPVVTPTPAPEGMEPESVARTLIFGVEQDYEPMAFSESGMMRGMSVEIAEAVAQTLGMELALQPITAAELGTQLSSGNIDCALGFDPAEVKSEKYTTGVTYMESDMVLAVRQSSDIKRTRDLRDQRVGTVDDPLLEQSVKSNENITRYASGATVYLSAERCMEALDKGWCSAVAMDSIMLSYMR